MNARIDEVSQLEPSQVLRVDARDLDTDLSGYEYFWQGEPFTGTALELDKAGTGEIISETDYKDGMPDGFYREWYNYPDQLKIEKYYNSNIRDGVLHQWYRNGRLKEETVYEMGRVLRSAEWDENGAQTKNVINEYQETPLSKFSVLRKQSSS